MLCTEIHTAAMVFWLLMSSLILLLPVLGKSGVFILFGVEMMFGSVMVSFISAPAGKWVRLSKLKLVSRWWVLIPGSWLALVSIPGIPPPVLSASTSLAPASLASPLSSHQGFPLL